MRTWRLKKSLAQSPTVKVKQNQNHCFCLLISGPVISTEPQSLARYHQIIVPEVRLLGFKPNFPPYKQNDLEQNYLYSTCLRYIPSKGEII